MSETPPETTNAADSPERPWPLSLNVGGQAILEGVMMRSPHSMAIVVRRNDGTIVVKEDRWRALWERFSWLRRPFLRGTVVFLEALHNGMKALSFSAEQAAAEIAEEEGVEQPKPWVLTVTLIFALALGFALFAALPHALTWLIGLAVGSEDLQSGTALLFHAVDGVVKAAIVLLYLWGISFMPDIGRVFEYHGAEHKAIFAYENKDPLTVEAARRYPTLHPRCGTSFLVMVVLLSIVVFSLVFPFFPPLVESNALNQVLLITVKIPLMFPVAALAYEAQRASARHPNNPIVRALIFPGLMLQHITTREPDDSQLEIAIAALRMALWREQRLQSETEGAESLAEEPEVFSTFEALTEALEGA